MVAMDNRSHVPADGDLNGGTTPANLVPLSPKEVAALREQLERAKNSGKPCTIPAEIARRLLAMLERDAAVEELLRLVGLEEK